jgi:hypothetical protein
MSGGSKTWDPGGWEAPGDGLDLACQLQSLAVLLEKGAQQQPPERAERLLVLARFATYAGWELEALIVDGAESAEE